ncbi:MAG: glycoside hydrolase family 3 N-terminal domain-containing protein [Lachnospiraceae bacterium]
MNTEEKEDYRNPSLTPEKRAELLLAQLSLPEKMAQVQCVWLSDGTEAGDEAFASGIRNGIGQVSTLNLRTVKSIDEAAALQRKAQRQIMENSPHHIPAVFHMEGLCGAFLTGAESFPSGISRGSSFDPELEEKIGRITARQELACGITQVLAPVLDVARDPRMGRQGETYGEDPTLNAAMGTALVKGEQGSEVDGRHTEACAKHFLGFHTSQGGIHGAHVEMGDRLLDEVFGKPFQAAIREGGLKAVMPDYCSTSGEPMSVSKKYLTRLLRDEMGFEGAVISDYCAVANAHEVQHIGESLAQAGYRAMKAGMDCEMPEPAAYSDELERMFASGEADINVLDTACRRVLEAKFRMGLFEHPFALEGSELHRVFDSSEEDREVSLQSARESLVLLKNDGVLPLRTEKIRRIALIGPHADNARSFFGGYTHLSMVEAVHAVANSTAGVGKSGSMDGADVPLVPGTQIQSDETEEFNEILRWVKPGCRSLYEQLREDLPDTEIVYAHGYYIAGNDHSGFEEALKAAENADIVILTLGGKHGSCSVASMGEGVDASDINLPECQDAFIREVSRLGKPLIGIHFNGRPISSDTADERLNAIVEAWNPSEWGARAISEVLRGVIDPSGRMPVTAARCAGQVPIYYNHPAGSYWHQGSSIGFQTYVDLPHTPRWYFGQGLSYTTFAYSGLELSAIETEPFSPVKISAVVTNTGERRGTEVVQLYVSDRFASMSRPVQEFAGAARVTLDPGKSSRVVFTLYPSQMAFLDEDMKWKIEKGDFEVRVSHSSEDVRLRGSFRVTEDAWIEGRDRAMAAKAEVIAQ